MVIDKEAADVVRFIYQVFLKNRTELYNFIGRHFMKIFLIYIVALAVMSCVAFFTYFTDKIKAKKRKWRISESFLLGLSFFGGAAGALIAMNLFRHKTKHWYFWAANIVFLLFHITVAIVICLKFL